MDVSVRRKLTLDTLPQKILDKIMSYVRPLNELVLLRPVCRSFGKSVKRVLRTTKVLDVNCISKGVTKLLLPMMDKLAVIPKTRLSAEVTGPKGYFSSGELLAKHCPEIEFFHWASPEFILSYGKNLTKKGKPCKVKLVRADFRKGDPIGLEDLLKTYPHIKVFADGLVIDETTGSSATTWRDSIGPRIVTITRNALSPSIETSVRRMLQRTTGLKCLDIVLPVPHLSLIAFLCPKLSHLRLGDVGRFKRSFLSDFRAMGDIIGGYKSFGLAINEAEMFELTEKIMQVLVKSRARLRRGPEHLEGTRLILDDDWSVEVMPLRRRFTTHIHAWPAGKVQWLYQLFPPSEFRPIKLYAISPLAHHRPYAQDVINTFLEPLANIRALHIHLSSDHVNLIPKNCPHLKHLRLRIVERDQLVDLDGLNAFFTACVAGYESFSLFIDQFIPDKTARSILRHLVSSGAKFRYTEEFGFPFLGLGNWWYVTSCHWLCIRRWPIESIHLFVRLFRPTKKLHITTGRPMTTDSEIWATALLAYLKKNNLKRIPLDHHSIHVNPNEPATTDF